VIRGLASSWAAGTSITAAELQMAEVLFREIADCEIRNERAGDLEASAGSECTKHVLDRSLVCWSADVLSLINTLPIKILHGSHSWLTSQNVLVQGGGVQYTCLS